MLVEMGSDGDVLLHVEVRVVSDGRDSRSEDEVVDVGLSDLLEKRLGCYRFGEKKLARTSL